LITGYNHNVKYRDDIFHVQTEDSGRDKAHIITHLYYGGNIIQSSKVSYCDFLNDGDLETKVINLMKDQHKSILKGLIQGKFDSKIDERSAGAKFLNGPAPLNVDSGSQHRTSFGIPAANKPAQEASTAVAAAQAASPAQIPASSAAAASAEMAQASQPAAPCTADDGAAPSAPQGDGNFTITDSFWESLLKAAPVILAEDLEAALDKNDDSFVFGGKDDARLDDIMLSFMKGLT